MQEMFIRRSEPGQLDQFARGTTCKVIPDGNNDKFEIWVQLSENEDSPRWEHVGSYSGETPESEINRDIDNKRLYR